MPTTERYVDIYDTMVSVWEEHVDESMGKRVFRPVLRFLRRRGWVVGPDPAVSQYPSIQRFHKLAVKGDLSAKVEWTGSVVRVEIWQDLENVQNPNGGRYECNKRVRMTTPILGRRCDLELREISAFLSRRTSYPLVDRRHRGESAAAALERHIRTTGHYVPELGRAKYTNGDRDRRGADGVLEHGQVAWWVDQKGRVLRGRAFYRLNNMWAVLFSDHVMWNVCAHEIFTRQPADLRTKRNAKLRDTRLNALIRGAVSAEDFLRAHELKAIRDRRPIPTGLRRDIEERRAS